MKPLARVLCASLVAGLGCDPVSTEEQEIPVLAVEKGDLVVQRLFEPLNTKLTHLKPSLLLFTARYSYNT